jgi:hypothetical protein
MSAREREPLDGRGGGGGVCQGGKAYSLLVPAKGGSAETGNIRVCSGIGLGMAGAAERAKL